MLNFPNRELLVNPVLHNRSRKGTVNLWQGSGLFPFLSQIPFLAPAKGALAMRVLMCTDDFQPDFANCTTDYGNPWRLPKSEIARSGKVQARAE